MWGSVSCFWGEARWGSTHSGSMFSGGSQEPKLSFPKSGKCTLRETDASLFPASGNTDWSSNLHPFVKPFRGIVAGERNPNAAV